MERGLHGRRVAPALGRAEAAVKTDSSLVPRSHLLSSFTQALGSETIQKGYDYDRVVGPVAPHIQQNRPSSRRRFGISLPERGQSLRTTSATTYKNERCLKRFFPKRR